MNSENKLKKLIAESEVQISSQADKRILGDAFEHMDKLRQGRTGEAGTNIWRITMNKPIAKLAIAAAIVLAVLFGIHQIGGGANAVYANVVEQLHNARTITYSILTRGNMPNIPTVRVEMAFKEPGYMRCTMSGGYITIADWTQGKCLCIIPPRKEYYEIEMSNMANDPAQHAFATIENLRNLPYEASESLGVETIDGRELLGFRVNQNDVTNTVWIDAESEELARVEMEFADAQGMSVIMTDFEFDVQLEDSIFSLAPPEGYTCLDVNVDVSQVSEQDLIDYLRVWSSWTSDGTFPPTFNPIELQKISVEMENQGQFAAVQTTEQQRKQDALKMARGMMFVAQLPPESNWRYAGENVKYGDSQTPIFWYSPTGSNLYKVIYGDLTVQEVLPEDLPK